MNIDFDKLEHPEAGKPIKIYRDSSGSLYRLPCLFENNKWYIYFPAEYRWGKPYDNDIFKVVQGWGEYLTPGRIVWERDGQIKQQATNSPTCVCDVYVLMSVGCPSCRGGKCRSKG